MNAPTDIEIRQASPADLAKSQFDDMFVDMYRHFSKVSGKDYIKDGAAALWRSGYERSEGKTRLIFVAAKSEEFSGFSEGTLQVLPSYMSGGLVGYVNHLYVAPRYRGTGISESLVRKLETWFVSKKVQSVELAVIAGNETAYRFWTRMGFADKLIQMTKPVRCESI